MSFGKNGHSVQQSYRFNLSHSPHAFSKKKQKKNIPFFLFRLLRLRLWSESPIQKLTGDLRSADLAIVLCPSDLQSSAYHHRQFQMKKDGEEVLRNKVPHWQWRSYTLNLKQVKLFRAR